MPATQTFRTTAQRYELISPIHEGPTATVWRARDTIAGVDVVVKQLNRANATDSIARARLREEAAATELISHPGAVSVIDTVFRKDNAALVFPFIPGKTLAERLRDQPPLTHREAAQIALTVADVLAAAHAAGVVHRDVKPANVLLGEDGGVRLLDFGIARTETPLEVTGSGMTVGTLPYMAPEQLTGSDPSPSADIFGLGVSFYEMLAGVRPFNGLSPAEQLQVQHEALPALVAPAALTALVAAMLSPLPAERPSAEQVGRSLRGWLDGRYEAEAVTAPVVVPVAATTSRRLPRLVGAGLALVILLLLGAVTLAGFVSTPAAVGPTGQPTPPAVAIVPAPSPTPTRTPRNPPPAVAANRPTETRSGTNRPTPPKADKKEGGHKKHGHGHHKGKKGGH